MKKKLPSVFANKVENNAGNNKRVFYSSKDVAPDATDAGHGHGHGLGGETANVDGFANMSRKDTTKKKGSADLKYDNLKNNINQKINRIFNSSSYIYKADVVITTSKGMVSKRIVGRNSVHLITIENELIPISDIVDIEAEAEAEGL